MEIFSLLFVIAVSLAVMIYGADTFLKNAEQIGLQLGFSSFVIGVVIVGFGTSLPELTSSLFAVLEGASSMVTANAIGSNIANILLIGGILAFIGKHLTINRDLLSAELPFFVISTALFAEVAYDGSITRVESLLLVSTLFVYFYYLFSKEYSKNVVVDAVTDEVQHQKFHLFHHSALKPITLLFLGLIGLLLGTHYVVSTVIKLASLLYVSPGLISITTIALGTSLPELVVSIKSLKQNKLSIAIGNIFGSNAFNILVAVGIPGLFMNLPLDKITYSVGLPVFLISSFIFLIIGLARKLYRWEGLMFFLLYTFFMLQIVLECCAV
jgi:cation:H+ antiporter